MSTLLTFLPILITLIAVWAFLYGAHWLLLKRHAELGNEKNSPANWPCLA